MYNIKNSFDIIFFLESKFSKVFNSGGSNSVCELKGFLSEFGYPNQRPAGFRRG